VKVRFELRSWRWQGMALSCLFSAAVAYTLVPGSTERRITAAVVGAIICAAIYRFTRMARQYLRK